MKDVTFLSCVTDAGANIRGSGEGGLRIKESLLSKGFSHLRFQEYYSTHIEAEKNLRQIVSECSADFQKELYDRKFPILLGGDHSCAMASISAIGKYCAEREKTLYVFWFDAHSDIHTTATSETGNIHGMPVAMLTGLDMTGRIIPPGQYFDVKNFYLLGARSIDEEEKNILSDNDVIFSPHYSECFEIIKNVIKYAPEKAYFHVSFDVDCLDPEIASGVSTPEENGFKIEEALNLLGLLAKDKRFQSMDIVEYNPKYDTEDKKTLQEINKIIDLVLE